MKNQIKNVMSAVFRVPVESIGDDASPDTIENWDSLKHMNLIVALEEEFDIEFNDEEILDMANYKIIYATLQEKKTR
ncbi:MAG: acyl carrier protein [Bacteroidota bacterium]